MKNKEKMNSLSKNYFKLPLTIFDLNLNIATIGLYSFLLSCSEDFNPSVSFLKKRLKISRNTVYKHLEDLKNRNIITVETPAKDGQIAKYKLNNPSEWKLI